MDNQMRPYHSHHAGIEGPRREGHFSGLTNFIEAGGPDLIEQPAFLSKQALP